jgi:hypothetical protein
MPAEGSVVIVYSGTVVDADLLRCFLDGEGIRSYLRDEIIGTNVVPAEIYKRKNT